MGCGASCPSPCCSSPCCSNPCCSSPCCSNPCCSSPCCSNPCCSNPCCSKKPPPIVPSLEPVEKKTALKIEPTEKIQSQPALVQRPSPNPCYPKPAQKARYEKHLESVVVVWLDPSMDDNTNTDDIENELQEVANVVLIYSDPEECQKFIDGVKNEKVLLIVSDTVEKEFVSHAMDLVPQIDSVYHYHANNDMTKDLVVTTSDNQDVYTSMKSLIKQMKIDKRNCVRGLLGIQIIDPSLLDTKTTPNKQDAYFLYDQLAKHLILTQTNNLKTEENMADVYEYCDRNYKNIEKQVDFLSKFKKNYIKQCPVYWYCCESFLYDIVNKALREHRYDVIYYLSVYIRHLHDQLIDEHKSGNQHKQKPLYRGQKLTKKEFEKIRSGEKELLSFPNFLSTSLDPDRALDFAKRNLKPKVEVSVLMEINLGDKPAIPYADIAIHSVFPSEKELLFSIGSVFRIDSIELMSGEIQTWHMKLTLSNEYDEELATLTDYFKSQMIENDALLNFSRLTHQLAEWDQSRDLYAMILKTRGESQQAIAYNDLGSIKFQQNNLDEALEYYQKSLDLAKHLENEDQRNLIPTYNNIGTVYQRQGKFDLAMENFRKAIDIHDTSPVTDREVTATIFSNMASVLNKQEKYQEAFINLEICLNIQINIYPEIHPYLAITYNSIATTCNYLQSIMKTTENDEKALEFARKAVRYAKKALDIDQRVLPPDHPQTKLHKKNLEYFKKLVKTSS